MSMPWLSWANSAECWAIAPPAWDWESSSVKTGGGPGGGGGGGGWQGALGGSKREGGAMGPWRDEESQILDSDTVIMTENTAVPGDQRSAAVVTSLSSRGSITQEISSSMVPVIHVIYRGWGVHVVWRVEALVDELKHDSTLFNVAYSNFEAVAVKPCYFPFVCLTSWVTSETLISPP